MESERDRQIFFHCWLYRDYYWYSWTDTLLFTLGNKSKSKGLNMRLHIVS